MTTTTPSSPAKAASEAVEAVMRIDARQLFGDRKTVEINYGDLRYTLRVTRENKLILTK